MPVAKKRLKPRMAWGVAVERELLLGVRWPIEGPCSRNRKELRAAWANLRDELLANWIESSPGSRPFMWWIVDSNGARRECMSGVHPFDDERRKSFVAKVASGLDSKASKRYLKEAYRLHRGVPAAWILFPDDQNARYETEQAFLQRTGLLTQREKTLLSQQKGK